MIPGSGRAPGQGIGYPLQYSWASWCLRQYIIHLQCRRTGFDPWVGKISWTRDRLPTPVFLGFPCGSAGKESPCNAGDLGLIPGSGRFSGERNGNPLQYSCLENPMVRGAWQATVPGVDKSWTGLKSTYTCMYQALYEKLKIYWRAREIWSMTS